MTRQLLSLMTFSMMMSGCAIFGGGGSELPNVPSVTVKATRSADRADKQEPAVERGAPEPRVGDLYVHRYSGSYRSGEILLTEEIVDREGDSWVIDYTFEEGERRQELRARVNAETRDVERVSRFTDGEEVDVDVEELSTMLAQTSFAPDYNEGRIGREQETCLVAGKEAECTTSRYHVFIGESPATLTVTTSKALPGRDVGGTIRAADGEILYQAELVEQKRGDRDPAVASRAFDPKGL